MTVAWLLEDHAYSHLTEDEQEDWSNFYHAMKRTGFYYPVIQTCWY